MLVKLQAQKKTTLTLSLKPGDEIALPDELAIAAVSGREESLEPIGPRKHVVVFGLRKEKNAAAKAAIAAKRDARKAKAKG